MNENTGTHLIDTAELTERLIDEADGDQLVIGGREWTVESDEKDLDTLILVELNDNGTDGRRLRVRVSVEVTEA